MNISEVQNSNIKDDKMQNLNNYASGQSELSNFSQYIENGKIQETSQSNNTNNFQEEKDELALDENKENNPTIAYLQSMQNLNNELFDMGLGKFNTDKNFDKNMSLYQLDLKDLNMNDIKLFEGLTQKHDVSINSFNSENQTFNMLINGENLDISYKSIEISKTLFNALENAQKTGKPVRLDFGDDASVILRIGKDGKISADFLPNDKAMEMAIKSALPQLKAKFEEENIPYGTLNYKQFNQQNNNGKNNNKEKNKDE